MALHVIENNLKTIFDHIYIRSMRKIDKSNNKTIFLCHLNINSTKNNFPISFCNEKIWNYFDSLDSCCPPINDWKFGCTPKGSHANLHFLSTYASLKVYQWLQIGNSLWWNIIKQYSFLFEVFLAALLFPSIPFFSPFFQK